MKLGLPSQAGRNTCLPGFPGRYLGYCLQERKKKKIQVLCPFDFDSQKPHPHRMAFNNQLAFQLLNIRAVSRGARGKRSPRGDPEQLT